MICAIAASLNTDSDSRCFAVDKEGSAGDSEEALTGEYTWTIDNFSKVKQLKLYSPVFQSGQYNWCAANMTHAQRNAHMAHTSRPVATPESDGRAAHATPVE